MKNFIAYALIASSLLVSAAPSFAAGGGSDPTDGGERSEININTGGGRDVSLPGPKAEEKPTGKPQLNRGGDNDDKPSTKPRADQGVDSPDSSSSGPGGFGGPATMSCRFVFTEAGVEIVFLNGDTALPIGSKMTASWNGGSVTYKTEGVFEPNTSTKTVAHDWIQVDENDACVATVVVA